MVSVSAFDGERKRRREREGEGQQGKREGEHVPSRAIAPCYSRCLQRPPFPPSAGVRPLHSSNRKTRSCVMCSMQRAVRPRERERERGGKERVREFVPHCALCFPPLWSFAAFRPPPFVRTALNPAAPATHTYQHKYHCRTALCFLVQSGYLTPSLQSTLNPPPSSLSLYPPPPYPHSRRGEPSHGHRRPERWLGDPGALQRV